MTGTYTAMKRVTSVAIVVLGFALTAASALSPSQNASSQPDQVRIRLTFDHRAAAPDRGKLHGRETGEHVFSTRPGTDYWLRLHNESDFVIAFETESMYVTTPPEEYPVGQGSVLPLKDDMEISTVLFVQDGRYSFSDMSFCSYLPPGRSVILDVPRALFEHFDTVSIHFAVVDPSSNGTQPIDYPHQVGFSRSALPGANQ